ncbi:hypothetical protein [Corynebacterium macginleyi]|uniref:hypothetical protein n=1 Tax=Corynebacterium macginleyi TaxID=38290 RepID=UPI001F48FF9E|nr:hypothetical protein [Corynebacterium macginleyi]
MPQAESLRTLSTEHNDAQHIEPTRCLIHTVVSLLDYAVWADLNKCDSVVSELKRMPMCYLRAVAAG